MGKQKQDIFIHSCDNFSGWDRAICEAERQIGEAHEKIKRLTISIQTFKDMRESGEPFPGEEAKSETALEA